MVYGLHTRTLKTFQRAERINRCKTNQSMLKRSMERKRERESKWYGHGLHVFMHWKERARELYPIQCKSFMREVWCNHMRKLIEMFWKRSRRILDYSGEKILGFFMFERVRELFFYLKSKQCLWKEEILNHIYHLLVFTWEVLLFFSTKGVE